jgi:hypothetical protein
MLNIILKKKLKAVLYFYFPGVVPNECNISSNGPNPPTVSYNAIVVKIYKASKSMALFRIKFFPPKCTNDLAY